MIKNLPKSRFAAIVALFISLLMPTVAKAQEAYAVEDGTTLTFYYDDQRANRTGTVYDIGSTQGNTNITKAVFDASFKNYLPTSTAYWFLNCSKLATIEGLDNLNTENVTDMTYMFSSCEALTKLDVSSFNTQNVTKMNSMFSSCKALTTLDLSSLNTEKVTNMSFMFSYCYALTTLDISNFNTENVTNMSAMFYGCRALTTIYCNYTWTCSSSSEMFNGCTSLKGAVPFDSSKNGVSMANPYSGYFTATVEFEAYAVEYGTTLTFYYDLLRDTRSGTVYTAFDEHQWTGTDITKVVFDATFNYYLPTSTASWFKDCSKLAAIEGLDNLNTSNVTDMSNMFNGCSALTELDLLNFNTEKVTNMGNMFSGCSALTTINCSRAWTCNESTDMFKGCTSLIGAVAYDASKTDVTMANPFTGYFNCDTEAYAVEDGTTLTFYYDKFYGTHTGTVYNIGSTKGNTNITKAVFDASFKNYAPTSTAYWFQNCSKLAAIEGLDNLNTQNVTKMNSMFYGCSALTELDLLNFNTDNVTDMSWMFYTCRSLTSLDVSNFNTENVTDMSWMFYNCKALTSLDLSNFNTANVTDMNSMFNGCSALTTINCSRAWSCDFSTDMFSGCTALKGAVAYDASKTDVSMANPETGYFTATTIEAYAVENDTTLTFYCDNQRANRTGTVYDIDQTHSADNNHPVWAGSGWGVYNDKITKVVFDSSFKNYRPLTTESWFYNCRKIATIEGIENLNTENVTHMGGMFWGCESLTELDVTGFNTANVTNMLGTFYGCSALTELDVSGFVTDKVTIMDGMFNRCSKLTTINVSGFNTENVTDMHNMFLSCSALEWLDLSSFNTAKVTDMHEMFLNCVALKAIYCNDAWTCDNSTNMFAGCTSLKGAVAYDASKLDVSMANPETGYFTTRGETEAYVVEDGTTLTLYYDFISATRTGTVYGIDQKREDYNYFPAWAGSYRVKNDRITKVVFDASFKNYAPTSTAYWFAFCISLETVEGIENLNTENVTDMNNMFSNCESLKSLDVTGFNTENVTNMRSMFSTCRTLTSLDLSNFNTAKVTNMGDMFYNCIALTYLDIHSFNTENVTYMSDMFRDCNALTKLNLSSFNTEKITDMSEMFYGCNSLTELDVTSFNTARVTNMNLMFAGCNSLTSLDVTGFNTARVISMNGMFSGCYALTELDLSNFNTKKVTNIARMFYVCKSLKTIYCDDTWSCDFSTDMFSGCTALKGAVAYDESKVDVSMANPKTGYFTYKTYAVEDGTTLTFYHDKLYGTRTGTVYYIGNTNGNTNITKAVFDASFINYAPTSTASWFHDCTKLATIEGLDNLNTEKITDMSEMFSGCKALTTIYCNYAWTCSSSSEMFNGCTSLKGAVPFDSSKNGVSMANPYTGYFTATVEFEAYAVEDGSILTFYYDVQRDTRTGTVYSVTDDGRIPEWANSGQVTKVVFRAFFNYYRPSSTSRWFYNCTALETIEGIENLNTENVIDMSLMFNGCESLTSVDVSGFNTANVTEMYSMFDGCSALTALDVSGFNTANVTDMGYMFNGCAALASIDVSKLNTERVRFMESMFNGCAALTTLDVTNFATERVRYMDNMFRDCSALTTIKCDNTWTCGTSTDMFKGCTALKGAVEYDENATDVAMANPKTGYFTGEGTTAISEINADAEGGATVIYNLHGVKMHDDLQSLPAGIYIVNGKKVIVK